MSARPKHKAQGGKARGLVSPARLTAYNILRRVEDEGAYASVLLAAIEDGLSASDRALGYELVLGVLRRQLWLDSLIEHYAGRRAESLDAPIRLALRLGLYQLRFLSRIPASAIVNESVKLAYLCRLRSAAPLVNAVLRRAAREPEYDPAAAITDEIERLAIETSHPVWLIERWIKAFGREEARAFARANNDAPPIAFRVVRRRAVEEDVLDELRSAGGILQASGVAPGAWRIEGGGIVLRRLAGEGRVYLQDEASQLVAHVVGARAGERVLDVCAAPGSKTTHMVDMSEGLAIVVAGDLYEHRLRTVLETGARQGAEGLRAVAHDAERALPYPAASFDRVLVDAPCTGTGTLRRNPEIRWRITATDIEELSGRQQSILSKAARIVRPCGRLVYSTCSVEREENEGVVSRFLAENTDFTQSPLNVPARFPEKSNAARIWPHKDGADGFFIASFERRN